MADPETIQNVKQANEEFERKYFGEEHPDGEKLMHDILVKRMQSIGGKQFFDSGDYNRERKKSNVQIPTVNEPAYLNASNEKSPPPTRLSPKGRRLSSCSGSSIADSTGCDSGCGPEIPGSHKSGNASSHGTQGQVSQHGQVTPTSLSTPIVNQHHHHLGFQPIQANVYASQHHSSPTAQFLSYQQHQQLEKLHHFALNHSGNQSPTTAWQNHHHGHGHLHHGGHHGGHGNLQHNLSQSSSSSHYSGSPLPSQNSLHMSPLHINTSIDYSKPVRRLSSTSSCGEPSPLAQDGLIHTCFKRPPIPGLDGCESYHGDAVQVSLHSPHSPCNLSFRGRSPSSTYFSTCLSDTNSCRNSPVNIHGSQDIDHTHQEHQQDLSHLHINSEQTQKTRRGSGLSCGKESIINEETDAEQKAEEQADQEKLKNKSISKEQNSATKKQTNLLLMKESENNKVPSQCKKSKNSHDKDQLVRTHTLTDNNKSAESGDDRCQKEKKTSSTEESDDECQKSTCN